MLKPSDVASLRQQAGFTLVELVIGMVVLAIALTVITGVLGPLYQRSTDPWHQVRAAELGHSFMNEIMARSFDEQSDRADGSYRCDALTEPTPVTPWPCTEVNNFGPDAGETRISFNDVDDFHNFSASGDAITNILANPLTGLYNNYQVAVNVAYDGNFNGVMNEVDPAERLAKRILVSVTTPSGEVIQFAAYRSNW
ncbi:MAG: prepilin-type N-terminal cleavage/methylation domain-containing protein [Gammaproteobacteria bacterium]|nr:prepilin-type N-terminal cleavage/methylation domain-containing protein [Gammaproteobacteria bacterium]MBU2056838.1 prepilin-type N-terminal cleavage/methylation domain-containing protein [Gammaproteobacteria bacterium]MBU2174630.1 prepilin-type N-terminal cleavage/methylation domain-containing protein [Gammaproteobacteria bacterium]MBU2248323.1 prepilin-type N-terminal cleavage/methylation domain-containing protein [Gammaproteobacteria bacterium]MBU2346192.1 prepilin-type N-terminal cleavag